MKHIGFKHQRENKQNNDNSDLSLCLSLLYPHESCEFKSCSCQGVLDTRLCDKVCHWLSTDLWFSRVSSTNKTEHHDITEILLKVVLNPIILTLVGINEVLWCYDYPIYRLLLRSHKLLIWQGNSYDSMTRLSKILAKKFLKSLGA